MYTLACATALSAASGMTTEWHSDAGVYDALKQKYLKCLLFGISEDEGSTRLLEV